MNARLIYTATLMIMALSTLVEAQSLADVARAEVERRTHVTPGRRYSDADLHRMPPPPIVAVPLVETPTSEDAAAAALPATVAPPAAVIAGREKRDEAYWRTRSRELLGRVQAGHDRVEAAQSALEGLDAAAPSPSRIREREVTAGAVVRLRRDLQSELDELQRFEARARANNIAESWLR
jgi:hypothetical protein